MMVRPKLVLASASPRRLALLDQVGIVPDLLRPAEIDESQNRGEWPRTLATRLSREKAEAVLDGVAETRDFENALVLAADTVVAVGRRVMPKPELIDEAIACLRLLSGRTHRVFTSVALATTKGAIRQRLVESRVRFKRLAREDIEIYIASGEWRGKAGGYAIQGIAGCFVVKITGSYSNIVGLPLYETVNLLQGEGYAVRAGWAATRD